MSAQPHLVLESTVFSTSVERRWKLDGAPEVESYSQSGKTFQPGELLLHWSKSPSGADVQRGPVGYYTDAKGGERYRRHPLPAKTAAKMIARQEKAIRRHEAGLDAVSPAVRIIAPMTRRVAREDRRRTRRQERAGAPVSSSVEPRPILREKAADNRPDDRARHVGPAAGALHSHSRGHLHRSVGARRTRSLRLGYTDGSRIADFVAADRHQWTVALHGREQPLPHSHSHSWHAPRRPVA